MKLRWYVERKVWKSWDSREDRWEDRSMETKPELQYYDEEHDIWLVVDTVVTVEGAK